MMIKNDIMDVVVFKEIIPEISTELECIMEHKNEIWVLVTHQSSNIAIEQL